MNKKLLVLSILLPLTILAAILPGQVIPLAKAAGSGLVCIAQVTDTKCPFPVGPTFNGPLTTPNSLLRVPVMINNTDPFLGFDITINSSDVSKLKPYGADLTGSLMPPGSIILADCAGGVLIAGTTCVATDNPSTVEMAVIGPNGFLTAPGTTGLLFTAIFKIVGTTLPGGVAIRYQNGCSPSSNTPLCVVISNGSIVPVPETTQTGGFDNSDTTMLPYATLSTPTVNLGQSLVGAPAHALPTVTFTATSQNGFNTTSTAQLNLAATFNGTGIRPTVSVSVPFVDLTSVPRATFTQTGNVAVNVPVGVFIATVTATYQSQDLISFTTSSLSATYSLPVNVTDYTINSSPNPVTVQPAGSQPVTVTIAPKASFNNLVKLGITIPVATASAGIGATFNAYTVSGGSGTSTLTVTTTTNTPAGTYTLTVTSNSTLSGFTKTHSLTLTIKAGGFTISAVSPPSHAVGVFATSTISVGFANNFAGTVALTNNTIANLSCQAAVSPASLTANGTATISCMSNVIGTYSLTITGTSGSVVRSTAVTFTVTAGFSISASTPASLGIGNAESSTITVTYIDSFTGTILLTNNTITNLSCQAISPASVTATGTASIACVSTIAGSYTLTVNAISGPFSTSTTVTFTFTIQTHDVAIGTTSISPSGQVNVGSKVTVTVQVQNKGPATEYVAVSLLVGGTVTVDLKNITLTGNSNQNVILTWDTSTYAANNYTLTVQLQLPTGDKNVESNSQTLSQVVGSSTIQPVTPPPTIDITTLAIIAGVIVVAAAGSILVLRRRRKSSDVTQPATQ